MWTVGIGARSQYSEDNHEINHRITDGKLDILLFLPAEQELPLQQHEDMKDNVQKKKRKHQHC